MTVYSFGALVDTVNISTYYDAESGNYLIPYTFPENKSSLTFKFNGTYNSYPILKQGIVANITV